MKVTSSQDIQKHPKFQMFHQLLKVSDLVSLTSGESVPVPQAPCLAVKIKLISGSEFQTPQAKREHLRYGVYFNFLLLGMGSLLPYNFFITPGSVLIGLLGNE